MAEQHSRGYKLIGTVKSVKGHCGAGHKVGDKLELSIHSSGGLCGVFYHDIYPMITMLQFGGTFPWGNDPDRMEWECADRKNAVTLELQRLR